MKIEKVIELVTNLYDETEYVIHIRNFKNALNNGLVFEKAPRVIKFSQKTWLKLYLAMKADLRKKQNMILKKTFFELMNNALFGETMENVDKI